MSRLPPGAICLVTDRRRLAPGARTTTEEFAALARQLDAAIEAGVDVIQIRERGVDARPLAAFTRSIVGRARPAGVRVLVNDRADVALAAGADGVHLRSDSAAASRVRALSADWILGQSVHAADGAPTGAGADYLLFGPVFETDSKPGLPAAGLRALAAVASGAAVPVFAIGGLTADRAAACVRHGARGIAAIGLFLPEGATPEALGPAGAVRALRQALSAER